MAFVGGVPYQPYGGGGVYPGTDIAGAQPYGAGSAPSPFSNNGNDLANYIKGQVQGSIQNNNANGQGNTVNGVPQGQNTQYIVQEDDDD